MQTIKWVPEKRKLKDLKEFEKNPRKITSEEFDSLKVSIEKRGFHDVIKISTDNLILSGNMRKKALLDLGIKEVNVLVPNRELTQNEKELIAMESNMHKGQWDFDIMANEWNIDTLIEAGWNRDELENLENLEQIDEFSKDKGIDLGKYEVLTVEAPEAPRLKARVSFYVRNEQEFEKIKNYFEVKNGELNVDKLVKFIDD